jgi:poly-beta-1,6-N-acetyl-D-glucosamine synthase
LDAQDRRPDRLLLVDDGSADGSPEIAEAFAASRDWVTALRRPQRPKARDRLAEAPEYQAFQWAVEHLDGWDVAGKLDADLDLPPDLLATLEAALEQDERLGVVGAFLSVPGDDAPPRREFHGDYHVRGATKFYRRACYEDLQPLAPILGWDTIDETKARMKGWVTRSVAVPSGDPLHLRATGSADGMVRAYSRWGECAYAAGFDPVWFLAGAARRVVERPRLVGAAAYVWGWLRARFKNLPRAEPEVRRYLRREQRARFWRLFRTPRADYST